MNELKLLANEDTASPAFTVDDRDLIVRDCLIGLLTDAAAGYPLADRLEECGDPRAEDIRELIAMQCQDKSDSVVESLQYIITINKKGVSGGPRPGTWLHRLCKEQHAECRIRVGNPKGDGNPARYCEAFEQVRRRLIFMVLGTRSTWVRDRKMVLTETQVNRLALLLMASRSEDSAHWAFEFENIEPNRLEQVWLDAHEEPEWREEFLARLDAIRPGWSKKFSTGAGGNSLPNGP